MPKILRIRYKGKYPMVSLKFRSNGGRLTEIAFRNLSQLNRWLRQVGEPLDFYIARDSSGVYEEAGISPADPDRFAQPDVQRIIWEV